VIDAEGQVVRYEDQTGANLTCGSLPWQSSPSSTPEVLNVPQLSFRKQYGVWEPPLGAESSCFHPNGTFNEGGCSFDQLAGALWEQRYKQALLANGVAVMVLNPLQNDYWEWTAADWGRPAGADNPFLTHVFRRVINGSLGALDPHRVLLQGWSAGAHMVSWMLDRAAAAADVLSGITVRGGVFFSGGSHLCYRDANDPVAPAVSDCVGCNINMSCFSQVRQEISPL